MGMNYVRAVSLTSRVPIHMPQKAMLRKLECLLLGFLETDGE